MSQYVEVPLVETKNVLGMNWRGPGLSNTSWTEAAPSKDGVMRIMLTKDGVDGSKIGTVLTKAEAEAAWGKTLP